MKQLFLSLSVLAASALLPTHSWAVDDSFASPLVFNCNHYLNGHTDLRAAYDGNCSGAQSHWLNNGIHEGRRSSAVFECQTYLARNPDLHAFWVNNQSNLQATYASECHFATAHWLNYGIREGRQASEYFSVLEYLSLYPDLQSYFVSSGLCPQSDPGELAYCVNSQAILHYSSYGINEGRRGTNPADGIVSLSAHATVKASEPWFPKFVYGFKLPSWEQQSFVGLSGTVKFLNPTGAFAAFLLVVEHVPAGSGTCPANGQPVHIAGGPNGWNEINQMFPGRASRLLQSVIVRSSNETVVEVPIDFTLPASSRVRLPGANGGAGADCIVVTLDGGVEGGPQVGSSTMGSNLTLKYATTPAATSKTVSGVGTETIFGWWPQFCNGAPGCVSYPTDKSTSFASTTPITQPTKLLALHGDVANGTFDNTEHIGPLPSGPWKLYNDFYVVRQCGSDFPTGVSGPADYYARLQNHSTTLLHSIARSGTGGAPQTFHENVDKTVDIDLNPGDCLVTLTARSGAAEYELGNGGLDSEVQVHAVMAP
jgi:hypothetical protein